MNLLLVENFNRCILEINLFVFSVKQFLKIPTMTRGEAQVSRSQHQYGMMVKVTIRRIVLLEIA